MDKKKTLIGIFIFLGFVLAYFLIGSSSDENSSKNEKDALAVALLGGGGSGGSGKAANSDGSLFGSNFWDAGVPDKAIDTSGVQTGGNDSGILDPASEGNPINPETGQPYPDSMMEQFSSLREQFPNNRLIPRKLTPEMRKEEADKKLEIANIYERISTGQAGPNEINTYYDYQSRSIDDRLELLNYVMKNHGSDMDEEMKTRFTNILDINNKQKEENEAARKNALNPAAK